MNVTFDSKIRKRANALSKTSPYRKMKAMMFTAFLIIPAFLSAQSYSLIPVGTASHISGPYYELTTDAASEVGAVWNTSSINLDNPFDYTFYFNFGSNDANGADGIVFVLEKQTDPNTSGVNNLMGGMGYGIGYGTTPLASGISPSLAVEFDTWWNGSSTVNYDLGAGNYHSNTNPNESDEIDHIDIVKNGKMKGNSLMPNGDPIQADPNNVNIEDGKCHKIEIKWIPYGTGIQTGTNEALCSLQVYFDGNLRQTINKDIRSIFSTSNGYNSVWWGITSATQTGTNEQYITYLNAGDGSNKSLYVCKGSSIQLGTTLQSGPGITYSWAGPNGYTSTEKSPTITPTESGDYTVTMKDDVLGCDNVSATVHVYVEDLSVSIPAIPIVCPGNSITLNPQVSGLAKGDEAVTYTWTSDPPSVIPSVQNPVVTPTAPSTTYTVTISVPASNGLYCTATATVTVKTEDLQLIMPDNKFICDGRPVSLTTSVTGTNISNLQYSWSPAAGLSCTNCASPSANPTSTTTYTLTLTDLNTGCIITKSVTVTIGNLDFFMCNSVINICPGEIATLTAVPNIGFPSDATLLWTSDKGPFDHSISDIHGDPTTVNPTVTTTYTLTVSTSGGCSASHSTTVMVGSTKPFEKKYDHLIHATPADIPVDNEVNSITRSEGCGFALAGNVGSEYDPIDNTTVLGNMAILRTDDAGVLNWAKLYLRNDGVDNSHEGWYNYIEKTYPPLHPSFCPNHNPDGYIAIGATSSPAHCPHFDMELVHTYLDGSIVHSAAYGSTISCEIGNFATSTQDQGYISVGNTRSFVTTGAILTGFVVKSDADLNAVWGAAFEGNGDVEKAIQLSNGDYLLFGITDADDNITHTALNIMVVRMDNTGSVIWAKKYYPSGLIPSPSIDQQVEGGTEQTVIVNDVTTLADGSFLIFGNTTTTNGYGGIDGYLLDIDENGSLQWSKVIGTPNNEQGGNLKVDAAGKNVYYLSSKSATDYQVCIATSASRPAVIDFQEQWNTPKNDITGGFEVMPDNGYAFAFCDALADNTLSDIYFARTDNVGHTGCELSSSLAVKDINTTTYNIDLTNFNRQLTAQEVTISLDNMDVFDLPVVTDKLCPINIICDGGDGGGTSTTLTQNGDFSVTSPCGSAYFSSDMTVNCGPGAPLNPGNYILASDAAMISPQWMGADHSGNGSSIFVGSGPVSADMRAWYQNVPVQKDEKYILCMWAKNICSDCPVMPSIQVTTGGVAGAKIAEADNINPADEWINIAGVYTADATRMLELDVVIKQSMGNAFALDDINFYHFTASGGLSPFVSIINEKDAGNMESANLYPNPVKKGDNIILDYMAVNNEKADISIIDATGKIVMHQARDFQSGDNAFGFQTGKLGVGVYQLRILVNNKAITKRFAVVQ